MYAEQDPTQNHNGQKMDVLSFFFLINKWKKWDSYQQDRKSRLIWFLIWQSLKDNYLKS